MGKIKPFWLAVAVLMAMVIIMGWMLIQTQRRMAWMQTRVQGLEEYRELDETRRAFRDSVLLNHEVEIQLQRVYHPFDGTERESPEFCYRYRQVKLLQARLQERERPFLGEEYHMETQLY